MLHTEDSLNSLFFRIVRLHSQRLHNLLADIGLYPGQPPILFRLMRMDGCSQKDLSKGLIVKPATMTVVLKRMEKAGLIKRIIDENDRRVTRVFLTSHGRSIIPKIERVFLQVEEECFKGFTDEERLSLKDFFARISSNLSSSS